MKLIQKVLDIGYPVMVSALGVQILMAPRIVKAFGCYMECNLLSNGVVAGCTQSNSLARIMLAGFVKKRHRAGGNATQTQNRTFVDDIHQAAHGSQGDIIKNVTEKRTILATLLLEADCLISEKPAILATNHKVRSEVVGHLRRRGITPQEPGACTLIP